MSGHNVIRSDIGQITAYCRNHDIHTQFHSVEVQFGAETWASAKAEKKNNDMNGAVTRRKDISHLTALGKEAQ